MGHRSTFSTCQCARSIGASTGVDPQKERRAPAANWFWQAMISVARPPAGHRNDAGVVERACKIFEEIEVTIALAMALWSIATGPRATRAGSSRTGPGSLRALRRAPGLVDGAPASGRRQAPGCAVHREKAVQRSLKGVRRICAGVRAPRARAHQRRPQHHAPNVFTACDQDYHVAGGSHVALLRQATTIEGAVTRARDSARPAAR